MSAVAQSGIRMLPAQQRPLRLAIAADVALVPVDAAGAAAGFHVERAIEMVESGEWPWAFDVSSGMGEVRELRVWIGSIQTSSEFRVPSSDLDSVIDAVIGTEDAEVRGAYLETRWRISDQTIRRLLNNGLLKGRISGHARWIDRASLVAFLQRRAVGVPAR